MADGAVNFLLEKLTTVLFQKASLLSNVHDKIEEIKLELETMRSFLLDAEKRKDRSESIESWVSQVREVAYEVEDIVDEFLHHNYCFKERHDNGSLNGIVHSFMNFPKNMKIRNQISLKLEKIKDKVHEVAQRSRRYGFEQIDHGRTRNVVVGDRSQRYEEQLLSFDGEDEIVGMEEDTERLLQWLLEVKARRVVVSIVGMGGLGKTTLVTRVYNNQIVKRSFDCMAWISVSQTGISELLRSMIKELFGTMEVSMPSNLGSMSYRQLLSIIFDYLHQKRYLIVLDDVWSIDLWSKIRGAFPSGQNGSRIILTTRNENVATSVGIGSHLHRLNPLSEEDAWTLFCRKAFWNDPHHCCPKELEPMAKALLKKCEGLPLAIATVGGLMCSRRKTVTEWMNVYNSLNWQLSYNPMLERIKSILLMSFNDLPFYLKHCFLYCCTFRDGHPIKRKKLIRMWVAEGFIMERKGMTLEEVAEEYLMELILRSMIQVTKTNEAGRVKMCRVHDVMCELAMTTSKKENFYVSFDGSHSKLEEKVHHLSVYCTGENIRLNNSTSRHLRSFIVFPTDTCSYISLNSVISKFRLLRLLNLEGVPIESIPNKVVELFNLRYLNLRDTNVRELPKSIGRLINLQTLDVRGTNIKRLPNGVAKLSALRHLLIGYYKNQTYQITDLLFGMLPPAGIWNLRSLQTLVCIEVDKELIQNIGNLTDLKRLEITNLRAIDGSKLCSSLQRMTGLNNLTLKAINAEEELQLQDLHLPLLFLEKITLIGTLKTLPTWLGSLASLTHLYLGLSCLKEDLLCSFSVLSSLVLLELNRAYDGTLLHFKEGWFPKLNKLSLIQLQRLHSVKIDRGSLSSLREFYLISCQELKQLPSGIEHLTNLQQLHLEEMPR